MITHPKGLDCAGLGAGLLDAVKLGVNAVPEAPQDPQISSYPSPLTIQNTHPKGLDCAGPGASLLDAVELGVTAVGLIGARLVQQHAAHHTVGKANIALAGGLDGSCGGQGGGGKGRRVETHTRLGCASDSAARRPPHGW